MLQQVIISFFPDFFLFEFVTKVWKHQIIPSVIFFSLSFCLHSKIDYIWIEHKRIDCQPRAHPDSSAWFLFARYFAQFSLFFSLSCRWYWINSIFDLAPNEIFVFLFLFIQFCFRYFSSVFYFNEYSKILEIKKCANRCDDWHMYTIETHSILAFSRGNFLWEEDESSI